MSRRPVVPSRRTALIRCSILLTALMVLVPDQGAVAECWRPPVSAPVADPFRSPACRWCPGNRGIEYATRPGMVVRSVSAGRVTFSGAVAGVRYVVVEHANGWRATYGKLSATRLQRGDTVVARSMVGLSGERFHFGIRDLRGYRDPAPLLGRLVFAARLVPLDGTPANPARSARLRCGRR